MQEIASNTWPGRCKLSSSSEVSPPDIDYSSVLAGRAGIDGLERNGDSSGNSGNSSGSSSGGSSSNGSGASGSNSGNSSNEDSSKRMFYNKRLDAVLSSVHWDIPIEYDNEDVCRRIGQQFVRMLLHWSLAFYIKQAVRRISNTHFTSISKDQRNLEWYARTCCGVRANRIAVAADRDCKRRVFMDAEGYEHRLRLGYRCDEAFVRSQGSLR